jgi:hypothetical protein
VHTAFPHCLSKFSIPNCYVNYLFIYLFLKHNSRPHQQALATVQSSSVTEGQQGFHQHISAFQPVVVWYLFSSGYHPGHKPGYWVPWLLGMSQWKNLGEPCFSDTHVMPVPVRTLIGVMFCKVPRCIGGSDICRTHQCRAGHQGLGLEVKVRLDFLLWGLLMWKMLFCGFFQ